MKSILKYSAVALCLLTSANSLAESKAQFCGKRASAKSIKVNNFTSNQFLSFRNQGGLLNAGVCWWHSRFQRNAIVLAKFNPRADYPNEEETKKIIKAIRKGKKVVQVPGYNNMREFSYQNASLIQRELEKWQKSDGMLRQQWIVGLAGSSTNSEKKLKKKMDDLYEYVALEGNIAYQKLQIKGIDAHAWLVSDMVKTSKGYDLKVLDSNYQRTQKYTYEVGMTNFYHSYYGDFVPYLERKREYRKVLKAVKKFCN